MREKKKENGIRERVKKRVKKMQVCQEEKKNYEKETVDGDGAKRRDWKAEMRKKKKKQS